ncbi:LPS export ABC transporter permease LptG [Thalassovita taeanensis]|uniref:Lipopolysaccharide export system permease protein n=1 Tax=Thalassovita taeanensis TaxID=657014 RepID=A0A1H8YZB3_9RHOB|nr:LPS export ABC transporter permease LptG [Thalassovita taeanensis]SEP57540.1 lipopolysaccharide export system permease protein [Thalassovita taeanensis]
MILHMYFARKFTYTFLGITGVFFLLMLLIDLVEQISRFSAEGVALRDIVELTLLNTPEGLYNILPLVMILATITLFLGLARSSELVVTRASGRSALRALLGPLVVAAIIGGLAVAMANPIVAATSKRYHELYETYRSGGNDVFSISSEGLWLRQGDKEGQTVIRAARADPEGTSFYDVTFLSYAPKGGPVRRIQADTAVLTRGAWALTGVKVWPLGAGLNPEAEAAIHDTMELPSSLTQDRIRDSFGLPNSIPIWDLPGYIRQLEEAGFSARRHSVWLQMELARPLFLVAMLLISSAFTMRHTRFGRTGISVLAAIMLGFGLYYIRNFAQILGENGQIPIMLAAWAPPVASVLLAVGLLLHMEDG